MFNLFKKKNKEEGILSLDIGTDIVKAIIFVIEEKQNPGGEIIGKRAIIKGFGRVKQKNSDFQNGVITDITSIINNCKEAITISAKEAGLNPAKMVLGISGELIKGCTLTMTYKRDDNSSKINLSELRNIIHKLEWKAFAESRKKICDETGFPEIDIKLINTTITEIKIDGYKVTNPLGFQGNEVQMSIFNSFAPISYSSALKNISEELNLDLVSVLSQPYALSRCLSSKENDNLSAIFIDIGGSTTDIALIKNGNLVGTKMFAIGGKTFTKRLAVELNISLLEAEKLKLSYTEEKLEQRSKNIVSNIIQEDTNVWIEGVILSLNEITDEVLPPKIYLCGGGSLLPEIKETLNNTKWYKKLNFSYTPQASFINAKDIPNVYDETGKSTNNTDITSLALVNLGIEKIGEESITDKAIKKVTGIMKV